MYRTGTVIMKRRSCAVSPNGVRKIEDVWMRLDSPRTCPGDLGCQIMLSPVRGPVSLVHEPSELPL